MLQSSNESTSVTVLLKAKLAMRNNPILFPVYYKRKERPHKHARVVRPGDDAVIEGFPRSANTFATHAFIESQKKVVIIGNHFHNPAQFVLARRYNIPAMLVLREPVAACTSYMIFEAMDNAADALQHYIAFHQPLEKLLGHFAVATFDEVTSNFGLSMERLNKQFGTNFDIFQHSQQNVSAIFETIAKGRANRALHYGAEFTDPLTATTPNTEKKVRQAAIAAKFINPQHAQLLKEANRLYQLLISDCGR